jgi:type IV secretion system protein VirB4
MMNLAEYRRRSQSLTDFLPWAALVEKGIVLNKDGSFQRSARFRGPDLDSSTPAELVAITLAPQQRAAPSRLRLGRVH